MLVDAENRARMLASGLGRLPRRAPDVIRARLELAEDRPLAGDWEALLEKRRAAYADHSAAHRYIRQDAAKSSQRRSSALWRSVHPGNDADELTTRSPLSAALLARFDLRNGRCAQLSPTRRLRRSTARHWSSACRMPRWSHAGRRAVQDARHGGAACTPISCRPGWIAVRR